MDELPFTAGLRAAVGVYGSAAANLLGEFMEAVKKADPTSFAAINSGFADGAFITVSSSTSPRTRVNSFAISITNKKGETAKLAELEFDQGAPA